MAELLALDEPRRRMASEMSGLAVHYDLGQGHPLLGRRMPDLDVVTDEGPRRIFTLLHDARPLLLDLGERGELLPPAGRGKVIHARYDGPWDLPAIGPVPAPTAVLIRPDGYVAWVGEGSQLGLAEALASLGWPGARSTPAE